MLFSLQGQYFSIISDLKKTNKAKNFLFLKWAIKFYLKILTLVFLLKKIVNQWYLLFSNQIRNQTRIIREKIR